MAKTTDNQLIIGTSKQRIKKNILSLEIEEYEFIRFGLTKKN